MPWLVVAALLIGGGAGLTRPAAAAEPAPSASATSPSAVKYYVVGYTGTPEREHLFEIAAQTLGDGRRYMEIFELNKGRVQPDGQRMDDPLVLMPGWILILPPDAQGPGVLYGPPPVFGTAQAGPPVTETASPRASSGEGIVRIAALVLVTTILAVSLHLLRRGRRIEFPKLAHATGSAGPDQPPRPSRRAVDEWDSDLDRRPPATRRPPDRPDDRESRSERRPPATRRAPDPLTAGMGATALTGGADRVDLLDPPALSRSATPAPPPPPRTAPPRTAPAGPAPARVAATPVLERTLDPAAGPIELSLRAGPDRLTVRLVGARPDAGEAFMGRGEIGPRRPGGAIVPLGDPGPEAVWLDFAASPDVITVTGDPSGARRLAVALARQLAHANVSTVVVGDGPGVAGVPGRSVASLGELTDDVGATQVVVAFVGDLAPADLGPLQELLVRRHPRVVPVVVGSQRRSRWSIEVG